eukprot:1148910-Pelagomonas_calceolata.AAC.8
MAGSTPLHVACILILPAPQLQGCSVSANHTSHKLCLFGLAQAGLLRAGAQAIRSMSFSARINKTA